MSSKRDNKRLKLIRVSKHTTVYPTSEQYCLILQMKSKINKS